MFGDLSFWINWLASSVRLSTPLALAATGGAFTERSGVFNIGIEGMMLSGAFFSITGSYYTGSAAVGTLCGAVAGAVLGLVLAYWTVSRKADQIITGIALNLFALGLTNVLYRAIFGQISPDRVAGFESVKIPLLGDIPKLGPILFDQAALVYLAYLVPPFFAWVMFRTTWGLSVRAVGEHPAATDTSGVSVTRLRYQCVTVSGFMAGLGGAALALEGARYFTPNMTSGRGFVVLGAIVVGRWNPVLAAAACVLFGAADAFQLSVQALGVGIPSEIFVMLPYILTVAALAGLVGRTRPPRKLGIAYTSEEV
jgi:simple sugar transport system permease protein